MTSDIRIEDENFLDIDLNELDKHWLMQSRLFRKYSQKLAEYKRDLDIAKSELKLVESKLSLEMRRHPEEYNIVKSTDKCVEAGVITHKKFQKANEELIIAKFKVDDTQSLVDAIETKKRSLENLTTLYGQEYWSEPRAKTKEQKEHLDEISKRSIRRGHK